MAGLLGDVLPFVYSRADALKRRVGGLLSNPAGLLAQTVNDANDRAGGLLAQTDAAAREGLSYGPATQALAQTVAAAYNPAGIVSPSHVRQLGKQPSLPKDDLFRSAVGNTPGASIADDGLLMQLARNQDPNQSMMPSVRGGVFYLPDGAAQMKNYSTGKNGYGGTEKIRGETLIQNPLFVKGATGGKAPEAAFDQLNGKGAYQSMRDEALKVSVYGAPMYQKIERAEEFLSKYAPELSGMGEYILKNSSKGNQLPYALQEAAAASAARNAGYDSIVGYSTNKAKQPFLSEVFDVRERAYPDKFGTFKTWD